MSDKTTDEIMNLLGCSKQDILLISAKTGIGVEAVLERVISEVPPPSGQPDAPLRALFLTVIMMNTAGLSLMSGWLTAESPAVTAC